ncbi:MAG: hypothetical protein JO029_03765 [Candidatus Eremiobacteraeota bacterium]|nr:hypothetical protein [Candidatus Eremiobacteraeota bacterium]
MRFAAAFVVASLTLAAAACSRETLPSASLPAQTNVRHTIPASPYQIVADLTTATGGHSVASLTEFDGKLFGTAAHGGRGWGTVFEVDPSTGTVRTLHEFGPLDNRDGSVPAGGLTAIGHKLYGTTTSGGADRAGVVFEMDPGTGNVHVLHHFDVKEGAFPEGDLLNLNGTLYGTTRGGGNDGHGSIYSITTAGKFTSLYLFGGNHTTDGQHPRAGLTSYNGLLYGTTWNGGDFGWGTVFQYDPSGNNEIVVYSFDLNGVDGASPAAPLTVYLGALYGVTFGGGPKNRGIAFTLNPITGAETILHSFTGKDGSYPDGALTGWNGELYGTTKLGGSPAHPGGTLFELNPATTAFSVIHEFGASGDGAEPRAALIPFGTSLYGTTYTGGTDRGGVIYKLTY